MLIQFIVSSFLHKHWRQGIFSTDFIQTSLSIIHQGFNNAIAQPNKNKLSNWEGQWLQDTNQSISYSRLVYD